MESRRVRGLWVETIGDEAPLRSNEAVAELVRNARQLGITDLFVQCYREGRCWFPKPSRFELPFEMAPHASEGALAACLELASGVGIRVHAWLNAFNLGRNGEAPILREHGESLLQRDNFGRSVSLYREPVEGALLDAPLLWIDPARPEVREYIAALAAALLQEYPELSGIHLDFVRFPYTVPIRPTSAIPAGIDFGYTDWAVKQFQGEAGSGCFTAEYGQFHPKGASLAAAWDDWRRTQVTRAVRAVRAACGPRMLSIAAVAWPDRAYLSAFQNWRRWLEADTIDAAAIMAYTRSHEHFEQMVKQASVFRSRSSRLYAGIGAYLMDASEVANQERHALAAGADGAVLFSYRNVKLGGVSFEEFGKLLARGAGMKAPRGPEGKRS